MPKQRYFPSSRAQINRIKDETDTEWSSASECINEIEVADHTLNGGFKHARMIESLPTEVRPMSIKKQLLAISLVSPCTCNLITQKACVQ